MDDTLLTPLSRWCEINLDILAHNIAEARKLIASHAKIMAVVKDNAYGHGDIMIAHEMEQLGIDFFAVSHIDEAIRLRKSGITSDILILSYTTPASFQLLVQYQLTQTLISLEYAKKLDLFCEASHQQICCHVKIDTGMHRLGLCYDGTPVTFPPIKEMYHLSHLKITGTYTHFAVADSCASKDIDYTKGQYRLFQDLLTRLHNEKIDAGLLHTQNTPATLHYPDFQADYIRVGTLLLGLPYGDIAASSNAKNFQPVLSLKAKISMVKMLVPGSTVSYGLNFTAVKTTQIAVAAIGYGDGYPRALSNKQLHVILNGHLAEVIGMICMDQLILNVTDIPDVKEGDVVTLIGNIDGYTLSPGYIAQMLDTVSNELTTQISSRVPRVYFKAGAPLCSRYFMSSE